MCFLTASYQLTPITQVQRLISVRHRGDPVSAQSFKFKELPSHSTGTHTCLQTQTRAEKTKGTRRYR